MSIASETIDTLENWNFRARQITLSNRMFDAFESINRTTHTLRAFFPTDYFTLTKNNKHLNGFLNQLLLSEHFSSLYKLLEYGETIEFFVSANKDFKLFEPKGKIDDNVLRNTLFELWLSKFLSENGFEINTSDHYIETDNTVRKPLDCTFTFENEKYLIECKKIYNLKREILNEIALEITAITKSFSEGFNVSELFGGYIVFNTNKITPADKNLVVRNFRTLITKYFHGLRHGDLKASLNYEFKTDSVSLKIISWFIFKDIKDAILEKESNILLFHTELHGTFWGNITLEFKSNIDHPNMADVIAEKIRAKVKQHKKSPIEKKIIALEFENVEQSPSFKNSYLVDMDFFKDKAFVKLIRGNLSLLVVIKTITKAGIKMNLGILCSDKFNPNLKRALTTMQMRWR